jgi:hypothetical protein
MFGDAARPIFLPVRMRPSYRSFRTKRNVADFLNPITPQGKSIFRHAKDAIELEFFP